MRTEPVGATPENSFDDVMRGSDRPDAGDRAREPRGEPNATGGLDRSSDDYRRAEYYRREAESHRDRWLAGRAREIAHVMTRAEAGDKRFQGLSREDLAVIGRVRWSRSALAAKLAHREELYMRWSQMYLAFAEYGLHLTNSERRRYAESMLRPDVPVAADGNGFRVPGPTPVPRPWPARSRDTGAGRKPRSTRNGRRSRAA